MTVCMVVGYCSALGGTSVIDSGSLRLEVIDGPAYDFRLIDQRDGQVGSVLLDQAATSLRINGSDRTVASASNILTRSTWLSAELVLSGGFQAKITFTFDDPQRLRVNLVPVGSTSSRVTQQFSDGPAHHYGAWESSQGRGALINNTGANSGLQDGQDVLTRAPFYFTSRNVGVYAPTVSNYDLSFPSASGGTTSMNVYQGSLTYHVMVADSPKAVLKQYNQIAGPAFMPPDWAFGNMFWKDNPPLRPLDNAKKLQDAKIPATVFWLDRPWTSGKNDGTWGWGGQDINNGANGANNERIEISGLPQAQWTLENLSKGFDGYGMKLMAWTANLTGEYLTQQAQAHPDWTLPTNAARPAFDVRNPQAYAFLKGHLEAFVADGLAGYKIDRGDQGEYKHIDGTDYANQIATLFHQLSYESLDDLSSGNKDGFVFSRFAFDTGRKYTALWNSDAKPTEAGLRMSMQHALRSGLINFPMWGSDTGGYALAGGHKRQLTMRWLAFSVYGPFLETESEPDSDPNTDFSKAFRAFTTIHHELIPYNRSAMRQAIQTGSPIMRAMFLEFPNDAALADKWDQYFLGDSLLVAPITVFDTNAPNGGSLTRLVYLPALPEGRWVDYNNPQQRYDAVTAGTVNSTADLANGIIPVFVREGGILVRGDVLKANNNWTSNWKPWMNVQVFLGGGVDNQFAYFTGDHYRTISLTQDEAANTTTLTFSDLGISGSVVFFLDEAVAGGLSNGTLVVFRNGALLGAADYSFDAAKRTLQVNYGSTGVTDLRIAPVPEPAGMSLLGAGAAVSLRRRGSGGASASNRTAAQPTLE